MGKCMNANVKKGFDENVVFGKKEKQKSILHN